MTQCQLPPDIQMLGLWLPRCDEGNTNVERSGRWATRNLFSLRIPPINLQAYQQLPLPFLLSYLREQPEYIPLLVSWTPSLIPSSDILLLPFSLSPLDQPLSPYWIIRVSTPTSSIFQGTSWPLTTSGQDLSLHSFFLCPVNKIARLIN